MKNNFFKIILPVISMAVISVILILYSKKNLTNSYSVVSNSGYYFDTFISISIYEKDETLVENDKNLIAECFNICKDYELIFSHTNTDSELYKLNISSATTTKISSDLYNILSIADEYNSLTNDAFNVLIGNIEDLWDFKKCNIPDDDIIDLIYKGYDSHQIATILNSDVNLISLKRDILCSQGHNLNQLEHDNKFLSASGYGR